MNKILPVGLPKSFGTALEPSESPLITIIRYTLYVSVRVDTTQPNHCRAVITIITVIFIAGALNNAHT